MKRFLKQAATLGLMAVFLNYLYKILKTAEAWDMASEESDVFWEEHQKELSNITIGCTFIPEYLEYKGFSPEEIIETLEILVDKYLIKDIRLGIRWNKVVDGNGYFSIDFYRPILQYCFDHQVHVCLNIGPVKSFGWPEEHIPEPLKSKISGDEVDLGSPLAMDAVDYANKLLRLIKYSFKPEDLLYLEIIQPENEGYNRFGELKLKMCDDYIIELVRLIENNFPGRKILMNSAERFQLNDILRLYRKLISIKPDFAGRLIAGYDYYYKTEFRDKFFLTKLLDSIDLSLPWDVNIKELKEKAKELQFSIEVTEAQFEPWGKDASPGNSLEDFHFLLLRCIKIIPDHQTEKKLIRLWGMEKLAEKSLHGELTEEHEKIIKLIKRINKVSN